MIVNTLQTCCYEQKRHIRELNKWIENTFRLFSINIVFNEFSFAVSPLIERLSSAHINNAKNEMSCNETSIKKSWNNNWKTRKHLQSNHLTNERNYIGNLNFFCSNPADIEPNNTLKSSSIRLFFVLFSRNFQYFPHTESVRKSERHY